MLLSFLNLINKVIVFISQIFNFITLFLIDIWAFVNFIFQSLDIIFLIRKVILLFFGILKEIGA